MKIFRFSLILLILLGVNACQKQNTSIKTEPISFDQAFYVEAWKKVERKEKQGLSKSILPELEAILSKAKEENNPAQLFKALAYRSRYIQLIEEESSLTIINLFEEEIKKASMPSKSILQSALGEIYFQYYEQLRYRLNNRDQTQNFTPEDIRSWSKDDILNRSVELMMASISKEEELKSYPLESFRDILLPNNLENTADSLDLASTPSLFEFLADRSLLQLQQIERVAPERVSQDKTINSAWFEPLSEFVNFKVPENQSAKLDALQLEIMQSILSNAMERNQKAVVLKFGLKKLEQGKLNGWTNNIENQYYQGLKELEKQFTNLDLLSAIALKKAIHLNSQGHKYDPFNSSSDTNQFKLKEAIKICEPYLKKQTYATSDMKTLVWDIKQPRFGIQTEQVYIPNQTMEANVSYKNIDSLFFRLYQIPALEALPNFYQIEEWKNFLDEYDLKGSWVIGLKNYQDYQTHFQEIKLKGVGHGSYVLLSSDQPNFQKATSNMNVVEFKVSNLAYFSRNNRTEKSVDFLLRSRNHGKPLKGVKLELIESIYEKESQSRVDRKFGELMTDKFGKAIYKTEKQKHFKIHFIKDQDTLSSSHFFSNYTSTVLKEKIRSQIFSDRPIYKSGQVVYIKGILSKEQDGKITLPKNQSFEVKLIDVNGKEVDSKKVTTNQYGSYELNFILLEGKLNGRFLIRDPYSMKSIQVEEYKRPSFEITLEDSQETYGLDELINLSGLVKTYSGQALSGVPVKYRVYRESTYPYWPVYKSYFPPSEKQEIAYGEVKTKADGKFDFSFTAHSPAKNQWRKQAVFHYTIELESSRLNGESQGMTKTIKIAEQSLFLSTNLKSWVNEKDIDAIQIKARNIIGNAVNSYAQLRLIKLNSPKDVSLPKYWNGPNGIPFGNEHFHTMNHGPNLVDKLKQGPEILNQKVKCNQTLALFNSLKTGAYKLELKTTDPKNGEEIVHTERFLFYEEASSKPVLPFFLEVFQIQESAQVNQEVDFILTTGLKNLELLMEVESKGKIIRTETIKINQEQKRISIPIKEEFEGQIYVYFTGVNSNRLIQKTHAITIQKPELKLSYHLTTFRDKVKPGSKEKWSFKVKDHAGNGVKAESMLGMFDQSLESFAKSNWNLDLSIKHTALLGWRSNGFASQFGQTSLVRRQFSYSRPKINYSLNWFNFRLYSPFFMDGVSIAESKSSLSDNVSDNAQSNSIQESSNQVSRNQSAEVTESKQIQSFKNVALRRDFRETAFFYPQLESNEKGDVNFEFYMPEALSKWKFRILSHNGNLQTASLDTSIISSKSLMVSPNVPRFFRAGDEFKFQTSVQNATDSILNVKVALRFFNAFTNEPIDIFKASGANQEISIAANENKNIVWDISIPDEIKAIRYEVKAYSKNHQDGETNSLVVLPRRVLLTETKAFTFRGKGIHQLSFDAFEKSNSNTLVNKNLSIEITANPIWYVVQSLPYIELNEKANSTQQFHRVFAHVLAQHIIKQNPQIKSVFESWSKMYPEALLSPLEKNAKLKSVDLENTPWQKEALSESEQKKKLVLFFNEQKIKAEIASGLTKLKELQLENGGWPWFDGLKANRYSSLMIMEGLAQLKQLPNSEIQSESTKLMIIKALRYLDLQMKEDYEDLKRHASDLQENHLSNQHIQYLYIRSNYLDIPLGDCQKAFNYYLGQADVYWKERQLSVQAMIAISLHRLNPNSAIPATILNSINDRAIRDEKNGMYWKEHTNSYSWYGSPIEAQVYAIQAFEEIAKDFETSKELKIWLINQKRVQAWGSNKATSSVCFSLLNSEDLRVEASNMDVFIGSEKVNSEEFVPALNYLKKSWESPTLEKSLTNISISKNNDNLGFGAIYWQYTEELSKVKSGNVEDLKLSKTIFKEVNTPNGKKLSPIEGEQLNAGDIVVVRLRIESKQNFNFIHLQEMLSGCMEPEFELSGVKQQDGLIYYRSLKNNALNFYFDRLPKGVYVFQIPMRINQLGKFSAGISKIQSFYAPEYSSQSNGGIINTTSP